VSQIEKGQLDSPATRIILERALLPMLAQKIDTVVLGCTHYPFVIPLIQAITGPEVRVIDPAPAIARQAARLLHSSEWLDVPQEGASLVRFLTTSDPFALQALLPALAGFSAVVQHADWLENPRSLGKG
jgi:glutamate racemase